MGWRCRCCTRGCSARAEEGARRVQRCADRDPRVRSRESGETSGLLDRPVSCIPQKTAMSRRVSPCGRLGEVIGGHQGASSRCTLDTESRSVARTPNGPSSLMGPGNGRRSGYCTDLRIYGFTPLPPPPADRPREAKHRIKLPPRTSHPSSAHVEKAHRAESHMCMCLETHGGSHGAAPGADTREPNGPDGGSQVQSSQ